jgi:hypothetical protein
MRGLLTTRLVEGIVGSTLAQYDGETLRTAINLAEQAILKIADPDSQE